MRKRRKLAANYLVDCGSTVDSIDYHRFVPDSSTSARSHSLRNENSNPNSPQIYRTAGVFRQPSKYEFPIRDKWTHMVRLHFQSFNSCNLDWNSAQFHVLVNGFVVLKVSNFGGGDVLGPMVREYLIWISSGKLVIHFVPDKKSNFAFVNAIEVISAPKDLIADIAMFVNTE